MIRNLIYTALTLAATALLAWWFLAPAEPDLAVRKIIPANHPSQADLMAAEDSRNPGTLTPGPGKPSDIKGDWPCFRGASRDGIVSGIPIATRWPTGGPAVLWKIKVGEGHGGAAVHDGRVYIIDYDELKHEDVVRCLSLDDGQDLWRFSYSDKVKRNHGMSRTVPAVDDRVVVTLGPRGHLTCLDAKTGKLLWKKNLVLEYDTKVPEWYAGQCPLIDEGRVIIAPGGKALMFAADPLTGRPVWQTPNPDGWQMTHSSILPVRFQGAKQYVWCASDGVVGIDAATGRLLWKFPGWRIKIATVPTPVDLGDGRLLFTGGYDAGAMMVRLVRAGDGITVEKQWETKPKVFGSDQQTPIYYQGFIYGVIPGGRLACITPEGQQRWVLDRPPLGLGPYLMIAGRLLALGDNPPVLHLFEVGPNGARPLAAHPVLGGHDAWAPIAFVAGRVIVRDLTTMECLDLR